MVLIISTSSSRSNESASTSGSYHFVVALLFLGTIGIALLGLPKVSSFSPSSPTVAVSRNGKVSSTVQSWFLLGTATDVAAEAATTRSLMEAQAGGNSSNRRRRKQRIRNSDAAETKVTQNRVTTASLEASRSSEALPDPLVSFDCVESVRLVESGSPSGDESAHVELVLRSEGEGQTTTKVIDPRELHQTSDFDLWMALRKHVVDVSASQVSVVLGTNYFTSREKLLQDKIKARTSGSSGNSEEDSDYDGSDDLEENEAILLGSESDEETKHPSRSNSKACAWGIKMEPLAFAQYSDLVEATNNPEDEDDEENESSRNFVEETGMYLLRHVDPNTQKTYVFGASPDGMVTEHHWKAVDGDDADATTLQTSVGLLEIKSLWGRRHKNSLPEFDRCPSRFYDQIQGQLAICDKEWCDLMLFIPPRDGSGGRQSKKKKRKGKSAKKRKKQAAAAAGKNSRKAKGKNYSIVRVKRSETYWTETVLPALIKFCDEVEEGIAQAKEAKEKQA